MKQQFLKGTSDTFKTYIFENNRKVIPSSADITIYLPGGGGTLIVNAPMSIGADGLLYYLLGQGNNAMAGVNYKARIVYVHNARTYYATIFYDVVNTRLYKVITDEDIVAELPQLRENGWRVRGTAEGGSASSITDPELMRYEDNYFTGGLAYLPAKDETREVLGFASASGTVATAPFSVTVSVGERYILTRSFSKEIQRGFEKIEDRLIRLGKRPHLIVDPYDLREVHIYFSVAEACKALVTGKDTFWWEMWKEYEARATDSFNGVNFKYDLTGEGNPAGREESINLRSTRSGRR